MEISNEIKRIEKLQLILEVIQMADDKIRNYEEFREKWGMMAAGNEFFRTIETTKLAKHRLENYYTKILQK